MKNPAPNLTILAGNLDPRNVDSIVSIDTDDGLLVGTIETYVIDHGDGLTTVHLRGGTSVAIPSSQSIGLSRSSDYNSRIARSLTIQEIVTELLSTAKKSLAMGKGISDAVHDIADAIDDSPSTQRTMTAVTPLALATA